MRRRSDPADTRPVQAGAPPDTAPTSAGTGGVAPVFSSAGRWWLEVGGWLAALMGAAHVVLPVISPWEVHVAGLYPPVRWALFATTVFFGVLLVFGGLLVVAVARAPGLPSRFVAAILGGMAAFWVLATIDEVLVPFPDPAARWPLPVFSALVAVLHLGGLWLRSRGRPR